MGKSVPPNRFPKSFDLFFQLCGRNPGMADHRTASRQEWLTARKELLEKEKELTRLSDELARERKELPWVPLEREYRFETPSGTQTLAELFDGRSQLLVYHFM